tara:strand:- start:1808 stop:1930 length:123 start_codon:yes stop_codon:yes gene_type:complete
MDFLSLPELSEVILMNRPVQTRLPLVVWGGGAKHSPLPDE